MAKTINRTKNSKVVKNKNGSTSTYTKVKKQSGATSWRKSGGSGKSR
jgi:hypothetical protein